MKVSIEIAELKGRIVELEALVKFYEEQFRLVKHKQFGASSEKSEYDQLCLFNEAEDTADDNVIEPELSEIARKFHKRRRLPNDKLPEHLSIEVVEHDLPINEQICSECDGQLHMMGHEKRRELKIIPAKAVIIEHVRKVYACRDCERDACGVPIVKAPVNEPVIKGSFASPEAIAHIMTQKFVMGSPLYRQEQEWNRQGIMLSRQTMSNWLLVATEAWLAPIYDALKELLLVRQVLHADETTLQVLREPGKTAQSKSYMWLYRTSGDARQHIVLYEYQPGRHAKHPQEFLKDFKGFVHADGYDAYHKLPNEITVVGCWAHARRKFDEALKALPEQDRESSETLRGKRYCDKLFELERKFSECSPEQRLALRTEQSRPLMDEFFAWLEAKSHNTPPKTGLGKAIFYALGQRIYLENYLRDGRLEMSNNRAERSIKPFVIGRKNFLFANTPRGAKASAIIFSLIETAKENGLCPYQYLTYIFKNAPNWDIRNNCDMMEFLMPTCVAKHCKADG